MGWRASIPLRLFAMSSFGEKGRVQPSELPQPAQSPRRSFSRLASLKWILTLVFASAVCYTFQPASDGILALWDGPEVGTAALCSQATALSPVKNAGLFKTLANTYSTDEFLHRRTQSYDDLGPIGEDPRWESFGPFHGYLLKAYPQAHATLELTKVNTYGLVYVWKGTDESLKPLLLTGHQDVVPVNPDTYDSWTHPPFSGYFDGKFVWGRGSRDDKSGLIGILTAVELLLESNFQPTRGVVLAFGFDEEVSGRRGASALGEYLLSTYGENAFAMLVDEGGSIAEQYGGTFALPSVAEKGYIDVRVEIAAPGGHSSVPPAHTTIGMLAELLVHYENNPIEAKLSRGTPTYWHAECLAAHAPELPSSFRSAMRKASSSDKALKAAQDELFQDLAFKALVGTTQAIDVIGGGVKSNALPENAMAVINHRIASDSSVSVVQEHSIATLEGLAAKFNLSFTAFGSSITGDTPAYGSLALSDAWGTALEPAPVTPTGADAAPYQLLSGTIKSTFNAHRDLTQDGITVVPSIVSGNTDTRYYWKLTPHIFRYTHYNTGSGSALSGVHTVNEACDAQNFVEMIRFFTTLILNADESTAL
ncbi:carboxypeptidase S [Fomitopsis serialis]|uniref:carboxypeptidase S n=1 Tax=Fomitopsis serialis TaxID=139415 RepID=UPI0020086DE0|nr:carboxypeptidase S [Neoantrodia serialis]KAH9924758.1 carboxypeptidase S [Neoantrodia serialis]